MKFAPFKKVVLFIFFCLYPGYTFLFAQQQIQRCGFEMIKEAMLARNPQFQYQLEQGIKNSMNSRNMAKTSAATAAITIPVIFHIVLNTTQLIKIGDSSGAVERVISQIQVLNEDFNQRNLDSSSIPAAFKPYYGNANIKFGLAHVDPYGKACTGWELTHTTQNSFDASATSPAPEAKHIITGGADSWDVSRYVNVWVVNFTNTGLLGLTIPPYLTDDTIDGFHKNEMGILLNYAVFGRRTLSTQFFYNSYDLGRTLSHEMGHYFRLLHPWGDDGGKCPGDIDGHDDGINDTPPEADAVNGCPAFPVYDACSASGAGLMFMNYMDYANDGCMLMFTNDQAILMKSTLTASGDSYNLTQHPELLIFPGTDVDFEPGPNPCVNKITTLKFNQAPQGLQTVLVKNIIGQKVMEINSFDPQNTDMDINFGALNDGIYFVQCYFPNGVKTKKVIVK